MDLSWGLDSSVVDEKKNPDDDLKPSVVKPGIVAIALGIVSDPPTLVLIYESEDSGKRKRRKRRIPLRNFSDRSNVAKTVFGIRIRHSEYLESVPSVTLEKMARIIQEVQKGVHVDEAVVKVHQEYEINPNQDLNKLSTLELSKKKDIMEESYVKTLIKPGDPGYVYNKQVDFEKRGRRSTWDEEDSDEDAAVTQAPAPAIGEEINSHSTKEKETTDMSQIESNDQDEVVEASEPINVVTDKYNEDIEVEQTSSSNIVPEVKAETNVLVRQSSAIAYKTNSKWPTSTVYDEDEIDDEDFW